MKHTHGYTRALCVVIILFWGCAASPLIEFETDTPAATLAAVGTATARDGRPRFREIFCHLLTSVHREHLSRAACDAYLWRLKDEAASGSANPTLPSPDFGLKILIVPGFLGECAWDIAKPFDMAAERLRGQGYDVNWILVSGSSSSDHNAAQIAETVKATFLQSDEALVLLGHSKGVVDILHFLVDFPSEAQHVKAVVSVAGAVNGSPLADFFATSYDNWLGAVSIRQCTDGDRGAMNSLKRSIRLSWLANHPLPEDIHYVSIGAFSKRSHVSPLLQASYDVLASVDPHNDGQLLFYDQVIPGSTLLGFANTDHWDVA